MYGSEVYSISINAMFISLPSVVACRWIRLAVLPLHVLVCAVCFMSVIHLRALLMWRALVSCIQCLMLIRLLVSVKHFVMQFSTTQCT